MRKAAIVIAIVALCAAIAWGVWLAWPQGEEEQQNGVSDLDGWEQLAQQYHRELPTGKDIVMIRLPGGINPRQITWSVTVNGTPP